LKIIAEKLRVKYNQLNVINDCLCKDPREYHYDHEENSLDYKYSAITIDILNKLMTESLDIDNYVINFINKYEEYDYNTTLDSNILNNIKNNIHIMNMISTVLMYVWHDEALTLNVLPELLNPCEKTAFTALAFATTLYRPYIDCKTYVCDEVVKKLMNRGDLIESYVTCYANDVNKRCCNIDYMNILLNRLTRNTDHDTWLPQTTKMTALFHLSYFRPDIGYKWDIDNYMLIYVIYNENFECDDDIYEDDILLRAELQKYKIYYPYLFLMYDYRTSKYNEEEFIELIQSGNFEQELLDNAKNHVSNFKEWYANIKPGRHTKAALHI
jgi:hypothetical protein